MLSQSKFQKPVTVASIIGLIAGALAIMPATVAQAQDSACSFDLGDGSSSDPYLVEDLTDLEMVRSCHGDASGLYFKQTADIDLSTVTSWVPIGNESFPFDDNYDGDLYEISNMTIVETATGTSHYGFIGKVKVDVYPDIKNIMLENIDIDIDASGEDVFVGGVVGESAAIGKMIALRAQGTIDVTGSAGVNSAAGGLFGKSIITRGFKSLNFEGEIDSTTAYTAGLVGHAIRQTSFDITLLAGSVTGSVKGGDVAGAVFGLADSPAGDTELTIGTTFVNTVVESAAHNTPRIVGEVSDKDVIARHSRFVRINDVDLSTDGLTPEGTSFSTHFQGVDTDTIPYFTWFIGSSSVFTDDYDTSDLYTDKFLRCSELNSGIPIQKAFFIREFDTASAGPCDLNPTITSDIVWLQQERTKEVLSASPPADFFQPENTEISIVSDPSERFSVSSPLTNNQASLSTTEDLPSGVYELTLRLDRPDVQFYTGYSFDVNVIGCSYQGTGTENDPYLVTGAASLAGISLCSEGADTHFKMTDDIDLQNTPWTPIGTSSVPFTGNFDGAGFSISGLHVETEDASNPAGLFGETKEAKIANLEIIGASVTQHVDSTTENRSPVGVLVGKADESTNIENIVIQDASVYGIEEVGVLIGKGTDRALTISDVKISGSSIESLQDLTETVRDIGLLGGHFDEEFFISDSEIKNSSVNIVTTGNVENVSGFVMGCGEEGMIRDSSTDSVTIEIDAGGEVEEVSGFITGDDDFRQCFVTDSKANTVITIDAGDSISDVGGFTNDLEESEVVRASSVSQLNLNSEKTVSTVGGFSGKLDGSDLSFLSKIESSAVIDITAKNTSQDTYAVEEVGLFIGLVDPFSLSDVLVSGSVRIEVPEGDDVSGVSNLLGQIDDAEDSDNARHSNNVLIDAVPLVIVDDATPDPASIDYTPRSFTFGDSNLAREDFILFSGNGAIWNGDTNPGFESDENGTSASASEFASSEYLEAAGFNFDRDWCMIEDKPRLEAVNLGCITSESSGGSSSSAGSVGGAASSFQGPVVSSGAMQANAGESVTVSGERLSTVTSANIGDTNADVNLNSDGSLELEIPSTIDGGTYDLVLFTSAGLVSIEDAITITAAIAAEASESASWTKNQNDGSIKVYAKNVVGLGKVQFFQNGEEVAWVRASDETDPKLINVTEGPMSGANYLVRTIDLVPGKNALEIYIEGERVWRAAYTLR